MRDARPELEIEPECPDCGAAVGQLHFEGCDVERCGRSGLQRLSCRERNHPGQPCQPTVWDGTWPGVRDCQRLGFLTARGGPDLNRLYMSGEAVWDPTAQQWRLRAR